MARGTTTTKVQKRRSAEMDDATGQRIYNQLTRIAQGEQVSDISALKVLAECLLAVLPYEAAPAPKEKPEKPDVPGRPTDPGNPDAPDNRPDYPPGQPHPSHPIVDEPGRPPTDRPNPPPNRPTDPEAGSERPHAEPR